MGKIVGSTMLIMGTLIGGGVLALPMVGIGSGFLSVAALTIFMWALMLITGFLFVEVNLALPGENSFPSMAQKTLGSLGRLATFVSYLLLLYALVAAYISGGGSLLSQLFSLGGINFSSLWGSLLFVFILGICVFHGIKAVDHVNRYLFSFKAFFLIASLVLLTPYVDISNPLIHHGTVSYIWAAAPIFLCSFGYHVLIPTITHYLNRDVKTIRRVLITGTLLTMLIYIYWLFELLGLISKAQFAAFLHARGSTGELIALVMNQVNNRWIASVINGFANITITTSFLGVSLGLVDFLSDALKGSISLKRRDIVLLAFIPPTLFALFYPQGFIVALGYASICVAFSHVMLPAMMAWRMRKNCPQSSYRMWGGRTLLVVVFLIGLALIVMQIMASWLPHLS